MLNLNPAFNIFEINRSNSLIFQTALRYCLLRLVYRINLLKSKHLCLSSKILNAGFRFNIISNKPSYNGKPFLLSSLPGPSIDRLKDNPHLGHPPIAADK